MLGRDRCRGQSWFQRGRADGKVLGRDRCRGQSWFQRGRADGQVLGRDRCRERKSQVLGKSRVISVGGD